MTATQGYKVLVTYNYLPGQELAYRRFMMAQWLPAMQALGLEPLALYHTMWGDYPVRLVALSARDDMAVRRALAAQEWIWWWQRLGDYVIDLDYCVVPAAEWFQFCSKRQR